ncbi:hypothetical protein PpBr36_00947 [Pyricularia pennisetigena]|uniref:hypothetical protein n=1 Tax=Pyricularia pennisetigena TaxID=1578925 RepID=UPI001152CDE5|nr:hypothetical protein PpBr36_00947 [Pyricularia pennisetigena]TLS29371.1 hypothetical protein PpBr36_00947 [Pyricularia pennisetigena]
MMASSIVKLEPDGEHDLQNLVISSQPVDSSTSQFPDQEADNTQRLSELCQENSIEKLENGLKIGKRLLEELGPAVRNLNSPAGEHYLKTIEGLLQAAKRTRTVVGVVGNTGSGKSSVLNALLDESELLATNCMRACTASATELSFNYSDNPKERYRAEVDFISPEDWAAELELLWDDLMDSNGRIGREAFAKEGDASIALAKVKAVYPTLGNADLSACDPKELAREPYVLQMLGTTKKVQAETAAELFALLQAYVDSRDDRDGRTYKRTMEAWPLVKVVRIYTKADALAAGIILVDLPGVHDSNAARAAVAAKYMKECSGLWIVAPITRAIDDKSAKTLLGNAFKQQLKFDGLFGQVTFICSKTDDISVSEAVKSLRMGQTAEGKWASVDNLKEQIRNCKLEAEQLKAEQKSLDDDRELKQKELAIWNQLSADFRRGRTVYPPPPAVFSKKRKHQTRQTRNSRRMDLSASDDSEDSTESEDELADGGPTDSKPATSLPLTSTEIDKTLDSLREVLPHLTQSKQDVTRRSKALKNKMKDLKKQASELQQEVEAMCIKGRNEYSRKAIQQDFAMGIKDLDQDAMIEEDESSFNPDIEIRDYDKVADSLSVFCVSSRAYQHLCGRNQRDRFSNRGYERKYDTEIPQLVRHAQGMTEAYRLGHCRRFMNELHQLVESISIWTTPREDNMQTTDEEQRLIEEVLRREFESFEIAFATSIDTFVTTLQDRFSELIIPALDAKISVATSAAVDVCRGWGAPRDEGGLHWGTLRATLKRKGAFNGAAGQRNFNLELLEPIMSHLASAWEETFQRRIPIAIRTLVASVQRALQAFHANVTTANNLPVPAQDIAILARRLCGYLEKVSAIQVALDQEITEAQREANRQLEPAIIDRMSLGYRLALEERGTGSHMRMKGIMVDHVKVARHIMFKEAKKAVQDDLKALSNQVHGSLKELASEINARTLHDYSAVLLGNRAERLNDIAEILATVHMRFTSVYQDAPAPLMVKEESKI